MGTGVWEKGTWGNGDIEMWGHRDLGTQGREDPRVGQGDRGDAEMQHGAPPVPTSPHSSPSSTTEGH